ncbi:oxidoreductase domain protein [Alkaliphilus metalliredigens QYMF]|uniref:Oxidoreductase domain protein n=1 Tax=Alkaliphilus metalliredigens (strain QYMF) TaxID=293826 RepID=A6TKH0_ALKMQ|nr:Gfo/Idh/MocA family oxidoreductase [Alkaliphilus metalliredigens]ABR46688.1 oxidoreductase domain protein [Alkaliphilus metalliredigens QYMF]
MKMKIRVGIVGCGSIAKFRHAPEYHENPNVEIEGFYDHNVERAEALAKIYGGKVYSDYLDLIQDKTIDAISDCSTNETHHIVTSAALKNNKSVLCEKPMTTTVENANMILETKKNSKGILMIDHNQRLTSAHIRAKAILKSGELGKVITFTTTFGHKGPEYWGADKSKNTWFFNKNRSVLGVTGDLGIHKVDLLRFLLEDEIVEVSAMAGSLNKRNANNDLIDVPDNMVCLLRTEKGNIGTAAFSWSYYGDEDNSTKIYCEKGTMMIYDNPDYQIVINKMGKEKICYELEQIQSNDNQTSTGVIDEFIDAIISNREPVVTGEDGIMALKIVEAAMLAAETNQTIKIDLR